MYRRAWTVIAALIALGACDERELAPTSPCAGYRQTKVLRVGVEDKIDIVFVVDNSASMADEQTRLREQFPNMLRTLTTGQRVPRDPNPFTPLKDVHVAVVSSDMGLAGVELASAGCRADGGDDGRLQYLGRDPGCQVDYPSFLSYNAVRYLGPITDHEQFARDVLCVGSLGTAGCGYEQLLEAPFKALSPTRQMEPSTLGFLRNDEYDYVSAIMIVLVTDEDDCSLQSTVGLASDGAADPSCQQHKDKLYDIQRYYEGFRKLRPGREELVLFGAIAGVPADLVDAKALSKVDFTADDPGTRNLHYDTILNDPRMQEVIEPADGKLKPSCSTSAYPPRRIVELAKRFDRNGMVQSICQDDWAPVFAPLMSLVQNQLSVACFPRKLIRKPDGTVQCNVIWELPATLPPGFRTPTECSQVPFLVPVSEGHAKTNASGGNNCMLPQLPVLDTSSGEAPPGDGWFYDDYTIEMLKVCKQANQKQLISFTDRARPPRGVVARLECDHDVRRYPNTRKDLNRANAQPEIGSNCQGEIGTNRPMGDAACVITLANNTWVTDMFCHPGWGTCVRKCSTNADCPPGWGCDDRPDAIARAGNKGAYCVNISCGSDDLL